MHILHPRVKRVRRRTDTLCYNVRDMTRKDSLRPMPFSIDRASRLEIELQVTDGIRKAILSGFYRPGDILPSVLDFSHGLGVSIRAPMAALKTLTREGLVCPRRRTGTVVLGRKGGTTLGHVLLIQPDYDPVYYKTVLELRLSEHLLKSGYMTTRIALRRTCAKTEQFDTTQLKIILRSPVTMAILFGSRPKIERVLAEAEVPFVVIGREPSGFPQSVGFIKFDASAEMPALAHHLKHAGVHQIEQVGKRTSENLDTAALAKVGIRVSTLLVPPDYTFRGVEAVVRATLATFHERYRSRPDLPEAFLFTDDYVARGAILALLEMGYRIPGDVKIASFANAGLGPTLSMPITRLEMNAEKDAAKVAKAVSAYFNTGVFPKNVRIFPTFIAGATL